MRTWTIAWATIGLATVAGSRAADGGPGTEPQADRIDGLIRQLGDPKFARREAAARGLVAVGEPARDALRRAVRAPDPEVGARAERVLEHIATKVTARELAGLQGSWALVCYEADGRRIQGENPAHVFTFQGETWSTQVGRQLVQAGAVRRIEVDRNLNRIELPITAGGNVGVTALSIYKIEGDTLKYLNYGGPAPTEFATRPGDGRNYLTLRRVTAAPKR